MSIPTNSLSPLETSSFAMFPKVSPEPGRGYGTLRMKRTRIPASTITMAVAPNSAG